MQSQCVLYLWFSILCTLTISESDCIILDIFMVFTIQRLIITLFRKIAVLLIKLLIKNMKLYWIVLFNIFLLLHMNRETTYFKTLPLESLFLLKSVFQRKIHISIFLWISLSFPHSSVAYYTAHSRVPSRLASLHWNRHKIALETNETAIPIITKYTSVITAE